MSEETTLLDGEPVVEPVTEPVVEPVVEPVTPVDPTKTEDGLADKVVDGAPEKYEDFTFPEGIEADKEAVENFIPIAKEFNLSQEQAQKIIDFETSRMQTMVQGQEEAWKTIQEDWKTSVKSDKEIGGPAFDESLSQAKTFLNKFGTPELMEALNSTGMGNHPEFIRAFSRAGKAMGEDKLVAGGASEPVRNPEDILFPNQSST